MAAGWRVALVLLAAVAGQQAGVFTEEEHPPVIVSTCTKSNGCSEAEHSLVMDAQWRWLHDARKGQEKNCISGTPPQWDDAVCADNLGCAKKCALEGFTVDEYKQAYGIHAKDDEVRLNFKTGEAIGSRVYLMEDNEHYKMFKLLNREFTFEVDASTLECGLNGAVYFVEMKDDGGMGEGNNNAGAKYGTGYCDAHCPHDLKFIDGEANREDWYDIKYFPIGKHGACCAEMDIWEANAFATSFKTHACNAEGPLRCDGLIGENNCGDVPSDCTCCLEPDCECCARYKGSCDKDGCDFNPYRLGDHTFYGKGKEFTVDSSKPVTVITQFLTADNTDTGKLVEIRRLYVQDDKIISNSKVSNLEGVDGPDSITDTMCAAQKHTFGERDDFTAKGGLENMGRALGRGMVLVLSIQDDLSTNMRWLDSISPHDHPNTHPHDKAGVKRGPCAINAGSGLDLRTNHSKAHVIYRKIKVGEINSTFTQALSGLPQDCSDDDSNCIHAGCCKNTGHRCIMKTFTEAFCRPSSPAGWIGHEVIVYGGAEQSSVGQSSAESQSTDSSDDNEGVGAECCTASLSSEHPCEFCYAGAAESVGWCAQSKDNCQSACGGTWCPNGAKNPYGLYDSKSLAAALPKSGSWWSAFTSGMLVALLSFTLLAMVSCWHRSRSKGFHSSAAVSGAPGGQYEQVNSMERVL